MTTLTHDQVVAQAKRNVADATKAVVFAASETSEWLDAAVLDTWCPFCHAEPGDPCRTKSGRLATSCHGTRWGNCPEWQGYQRGLHVQWAYQALSQAQRALAELQ